MTQTPLPSVDDLPDRDPMGGEERIAVMMLGRLRLAVWAILASLPVPLAYALFVRPAWPLAVAVSVPMITSGGLAAMLQRQRIPARLAAPLVFVIWTLVVLAVGCAHLVYRDPGYTFVLAMLVLSHAAVQLVWSWFGAAYLVGGVTWLLVGPLSGLGLQFVDALSWVGASALGILVFAGNRSVLLRLERLRAIAEDNSRALSEALAAARKEIVEREHAESERDSIRQQFVAAQKMEAVGRLAGGVAHDVNNLLSGILAMAEFCRDNGPDDLRPDLDEIVASCVRGGQLTRQLLGFSRRHRAASELIGLDSVVNQVVAILTRTLPKRIRLETALAGDLMVEGDAAQLGQALLNICINGMDAITGAGVLRVEARDLQLDEATAARYRLPVGDYVELDVRDTGSGMDPLTSARVFEPFFTTKAGRGTGLGLAMVYGTIKAHRGGIDVESEPGKGTRIRVFLPRVLNRAAKAALLPVVAPDTGRRLGRFLVVDDDPLVRSTTQRLLTKAGHEVVVAEDGVEALEVYARTPGLDGVILDMSMPHMGGADCFHALRASHPGVRVILMSGFARSEEVRACLAAGALGFVGKPFSAARMHDAAGALVQGTALPPEDEGGENPLE